jgi:uncharacterized protein
VKIVIDTNVLISAVYFGGAPKAILTAWFEKNAFDVAVSKEIIEEYRRILQRFDDKRGTKFTGEIISGISSVANFVDVKSTKSYSRDPDDDKFVNCAVDAKAIYIVSGDNDLLVLGQVANIEILTASQFLEKMKSSHAPRNT